MTLLEVAFACVFVVPYHLNGEEWRVRLKVEPTGDKEVLSAVNAIAPDGTVVLGGVWDEMVEKADLVSEFWVAVINYMLFKRLEVGRDLGPVGTA